MRTVIIILIGLAVGLIAMRLSPARHHNIVAWLFAVAWLLACAFNLRTGLSHGYSLREELPIHVLLYAIPVLAVAYCAWRSRHG